MGLFDFLKPKKSIANNAFEKLSSSMFPNGNKDIEAGAEEVMNILENRVDKSTAKSILVKSVAISQIAENFDENRLIVHLEGYCIQYFDEVKMKQFYSFLRAIEEAALVSRKGASEIRRENEQYVW